MVVVGVARWWAWPSEETDAVELVSAAVRRGRGMGRGSAWLRCPLSDLMLYDLT